MKYLLDSNTCIRYLTGRSQAVLNKIDSTPQLDMCVCSIVKFELRFGALRSQNVEKTLVQQEKFFRRFISLPFDDDAQIYASQIRADLATSGNPIGPYDLLIAAIALANDVILVTHNVREFSRVANLKIEDWESI